jgi:hypothetical protein
MHSQDEKRIYFVWGLKRSGIHFCVDWLFDNAGGRSKARLPSRHGFHPQLRDGFCDREAGVFFFNNCGRSFSREFSLGTLDRQDFERAAASHRVTIFGIEDCDIARYASRACLGVAMHVVIMRDPLNNIASRLRGQEDRPQVFRVDERYVELYETYCREFLGETAFVQPKVAVSYNRFVQERSYRDAVATELHLANRDLIDRVSNYGGGSSFSGRQSSSVPALLTRYREEPVAPPLVRLLLSKPSIGEICRRVFHYELADVIAQERMGDRARGHGL